MSEEQVRSKILTGRKRIFTDYPVIDSSNVIEVLQEALVAHGQNVEDENFLLNYEAGIQPLVRKKTYRPEIDIEVVDNVAAEVCDFKCGYVWGNSITLVQRGKEDSNPDDEVNAISLLNEQYDINGIREKTQDIGFFVERVGVCPVFVDINSDEDDALFSIVPLDPRDAFVVYSNYYFDHRPMMGVAFRTFKNGNQHFTVFTNDTRFEIDNAVRIVNGQQREEWSESSRSGEWNPLGMIPIVEYIRAYDRSSCFERQIPEMDNLNIMLSDFTNDVDQNTQAVWFGVDIEFPVNEKGETIKPKDGDWVLAHRSEQGTPAVHPLTIPYDYSGMMSQMLSRRSLILQKCYVPQRNDNSGGSTGIAMSDATGWSAAENDAEREQNLIDTVKMQEVKLVLKAISMSPYVDKDSPLLKLGAKDIQPKTQRQKTYELTVKANALATMLSHGIYGKHAIDTVNMFPDPNQVWADSMKLIEKYQYTAFDPDSRRGTSTSVGEGGVGEKSPNSDRTMSDYSDQRTNSPNIDGMNVRGGQ